MNLFEPFFLYYLNFDGCLDELLERPLLLSATRRTARVRGCNREEKEFRLLPGLDSYILKYGQLLLLQPLSPFLPTRVKSSLTFFFFKGSRQGR